MSQNQIDVIWKQVGYSVIETISIQALIPENFRIELNEEARMLSLINVNIAHIIAQQQFTKNEWSILITLLESHPYHAPHEILLSRLTSLSPDDCRRTIQEAQEESAKALKRELKPVYRALSGIRIKLHELLPSLEIRLIRNIGYILAQYSTHSFYQPHADGTIKRRRGSKIAARDIAGDPVRPSQKFFFKTRELR